MHLPDSVESSWVGHGVKKTFLHRRLVENLFRMSIQFTYFVLFISSNNDVNASLP